MIGYINKILYIIADKKQKLILLFFMTLLTSILEVFGVGLLGPFLRLASEPDTVHEIPVLNEIYKQLNLESSQQFIPILGLGIIIIFCLKSIAYISTNSFLFNFCFNQKKNLVSRLMSAYLNAPYTFFMSKNTGDIIQKITAETTIFAQECLLSILAVSVNLIAITCLFLLLAKTDLMLLTIILGVFLVIFFISEQLGHKIAEWGKRRAQADQEMIRVINHGLGGLKETRIIGCEPYFEQQMMRQGSKWARAVTLFRSSKMIFPALIQSSLVMVIVAFVCISQLISNQSVQDITSIMAVFAAASLRLIPATNNFIQATGTIRNTSYSVQLIYSDLKELEAVGNKHQPKLLAQTPALKSSLSSILPFKNKIEIKNIQYQYPGTSENVINNISLTLKKGESIAFIGKSGAGKTTLVDIFLGLLHPQHGDIAVDQVSIYENLRSWQNLIGYIPQSIFLIDDTIERNIAFGVPDEHIDYERLYRAVAAAQLTELIERLPEGVKTHVGERGLRLSGGQRQRIGIARALYHEREILVLDEATSALDNETEYLVSEAIKSLAGTKTMIIIAHRLSTVEHCDRIYQLEKGRIVRSGSFQDVVETA